MLKAADVARLQTCLQQGGVALLGTDTVYGLVCDPEQPAAVERLYGLKGRSARQPAAVMFFSLAAALAALPELAELGARARALLPGALTLLLANPHRRYALACASTPDTLGVRVPRLTVAAAALSVVTAPVLQSSANPSGGHEPRRLGDVAPPLRDQVDLTLDVGELPGLASTVLDVRELAPAGRFRIVREGAVSPAEVARILGGCGGAD